MKIEEVLELQLKLQEDMGRPMDGGGGGNISAGVKENMLALIVEATEVLNEVNWKPWKPLDKVIDRQALLTELVDVLQFWSNAVSAAGFTATDVAAAYREKLRVCYVRIAQRQSSELSRNLPHVDNR